MQILREDNQNHNVVKIASFNDNKVTWLTDMINFVVSIVVAVVTICVVLLNIVRRWNVRIGGIVGNVKFNMRRSISFEKRTKLVME